MANTYSFSGFSYLFRGFEWLTRPGLRRFVIIPMLINIILLSLTIGLGFHLIQTLVNLLPHWLHWLTWLIWPIFFVASAVIAIYLFTLLANLVGAPFNSLLSEKVEMLALGQKPNEQGGALDAIQDIPRTVTREWKKIKYYLPRALILLVLFFIPIVNVAASLFWFIFGCWMMAVQYVDYPIDNARGTLDDLHRYLKKERFLAFTFGLGVVLFSMIPIINLAVMPAAVIGATLMVVENRKK